VGGHGINDFVAQAAGAIGFRKPDELWDVAGSAFGDHGAEAGFEKVALLFAQVDAARPRHEFREESRMICVL
jgi:hypothetical protein